jgi:MoxR-like ATPase
MTPDVLPSDITGTTIYREHTGEFETRKGPVFSNVLLTDEVNRAPPKTQSALLEAMQEGKVTIEGETLSLPSPFVVIGTQNPIEIEGTYGLPVAQKDRFMFKLVVDLPERTDEFELLNRFDGASGLDSTVVEQAVTSEELMRAKATAEAVYVDDRVKAYILDLVEATRNHERVEHGASPRASLFMQRASKARAAIRGRDYVVPDDVKSIAEWLLAHRLVLRPEVEMGETTTSDVVADVLADVDVSVDRGDLQSEQSGTTRER